MVFSSVVFLFLFLPATLAGYFLIRGELRNAWLLAASLFFYAWGEREYTWVMLLSITGNYLFGLGLHRAQGKPAAGWLLAVAVTLNLAMLIAFKYANFLVDNLNPLFASVGIGRVELGPVHLPVGISFFTFHAISYIVDIYRGHGGVQFNPLNFGMYITLFPQLVAGPIIRYCDVDRQLTERCETLSDFAEGVLRFTLGLGKKILLANTLGAAADSIFALPPTDLTAPIAWCGIVCYALQIYYDFSGYSDMAIGIGLMLGFHFRENFNYPYIAASITEFWRRWHISLSTWFRDYLYIPLGGNRKSSARTAMNLLIVFFLCGLWHGASWAFVAWGLFHGAFLCLERWVPAPARIPVAVKHLYTLLVVLVGWVFFRVETLDHARHFLVAMAGFSKPETTQSVFLFMTNEVFVCLVVAMIGSAPVIPALRRWAARVEAGREGNPTPASLAFQSFSSLFGIGAMAAVWLGCAIKLSAGTYNPFIYFRF